MASTLSAATPSGLAFHAPRRIAVPGLEVCEMTAVLPPVMRRRAFKQAHSLHSLACELGRHAQPLQRCCPASITLCSALTWN